MCKRKNVWATWPAGKASHPTIGTPAHYTARACALSFPLSLTFESAKKKSKVIFRSNPNRPLSNVTIDAEYAARGATLKLREATRSTT